MKTRVLIIIVLAQFLCTSLWFAGNAVVDDLILTFGFPENAVGNLTSVIQLGFIVGTLFYALLNIADRFSPSKVFFISAILAAGSNLLILGGDGNYSVALVSRFLTGFFLAGIYPVGMKIAADYYDKDLGKSLGLLVGALVLGTAFPHLIKSLMGELSFRYVIIATSALALIGGILIFTLVPDGPFRRPSQKIQMRKAFAAFSKSEFRAAAFGYFGHMWELYAVLAFFPAMLLYHQDICNVNLDTSFWSFIIIAAGGVGCAISGILSQRFQPKVIATVALATSGAICLLSPFIFSMSIFFIPIMIVWGVSISSDSPMFSTLVAKHAIPELKGTALTLVNCIGFALTVVSIQLMGYVAEIITFKYLFVFLGIGPLFGLWSMWRK
ncbi:MFS transporter [Portibacter lacus]|uniref:Membrane protein n=1 Tax=Portibacter lacus TaxID=1099794 RepID=A0AA37WG01_9BACT|nr:MFS transporter [Portibacter lacus]GLR17490.1 membrane protein [Portibacter lacus]